MNTELKEKMKKAALQNADDRFDRVHSADSHACRYAAFLAGAEAMYTALQEQIEWINVEDRLPEERTIVLIKTSFNNYYNSYFLDGKWVIKKWITESPYFVGEITHWRKIDL
jgi:hypothetical protein